MADLERILDHWDHWVRMYLLAVGGDGNSLEDAADFARGHTIGLLQLDLPGKAVAFQLRRYWPWVG